jgi:hypothetical protein
MDQSWKDNDVLFLSVVGVAAWLVPGGGHFLLNERKRAVVIGVTILVTFLLGLYVGSVGVIDPIGARPWYAAQLMNSPFVFFLGKLGAGGAYPVYGRPNEIGQIYTSIAGLLNLLCIVNAVYMAHLRGVKEGQS